jgi:HEAT repeat protein
MGAGMSSGRDPNAALRREELQVSGVNHPNVPAEGAAPALAVVRFLDAVERGDDEATEALVGTLSPSDEAALIAVAAHSEEVDRRWWALRALAAVGGADSARALAAAAQDRDPSVRAVVALGMGHLYARSADANRADTATAEAVGAELEALVPLLQDDDGFVRKAAVDGFSLCGEAALPLLQRILLEGTHEGARTRAASALRSMRSMKAAPLLWRILNDRNPLVHTYAHEALDDLGLLDNVLLLP